MKTLQDLENVEDKMAIFRDFELLKQYVVTVKDLIDAFSYLGDNQKLEVMNFSYFKNLSQSSKASAIMTITDNAVKRQILQNTALVEEVFDQYNFCEFLISTDDQTKNEVLNNLQLINKFNLNGRHIRKIIMSMSNEGKTNILSNTELIKQLGIESFDLSHLIATIEDDEIKIQLSKDYELREYEELRVILSLSTQKKKEVLLEGKIEIENRYIVDIISSLSNDELTDFINNQQTFLQNKGIKSFHVIKKMPYEKQLEMTKNIAQLKISEAEKRRMYASLKNETKEAIDIEEIDEEYRPLLGMELSEDVLKSYGKIIVNLNEDLSQYQDLDELLGINPLEMVKSDKDREHLLQLCKICPNMDITDNLSVGISSGREYVTGETWISSVLEGIQPEWTDIQKLAHIDTAIGKRISYSPEFGTEAEKTDDSRALWRIITEGYGVCNGIAQIEKYLLARVGIESELVSGKHHSFVKIKNIAIPTECGIIQGDTLVDPTWNLAASRFGAMPQHFCKSYEELRKVDIEDNGKDRKCHKNEELEQAQTINMDIESLREVYKSIGIAGQDGKFPIGQLIVQAREIDETSSDMKSNINRKFALLKEWCPEFASCQNSTISVIQDVLFETNDKFDFKKCIASRVYDRADDNRDAVLYIYMELEEQQKMFFYADKQSGEFISLSQEQFEAKFECYDRDLEKATDNKRPWENGEKIQENKENSSGQVSAEEGR
ncbi:MAG: hypothetical protein IJE68_00390 [Clostridia bacterium]|nr:hypothetical protein [Clostridia bacterium]